MARKLLVACSDCAEGFVCETMPIHIDFINGLLGSSDFNKETGIMLLAGDFIKVFCQTKQEPVLVNF